MERFAEVSPRRRGPEICRARNIIQGTRRFIHFAIVADKLDLSSTHTRLEREKEKLYCVVNELVYLISMVAHSHFTVSISRPFFLLYSCF